ncbi:hypothetical protein BKA62DRAFT_699695 [Auriculariales sp. MPI-PUGE-AT-0066]|nr:hypothetical protein BKA62DRAFT_699695 [Auriculariales sp. MPI-PUGE-AT-0066]
MWVLTGPFDAKEEGATERVSKLLKTGTNYVLTRKNHNQAPRLQVNLKSISKEHAYFLVDGHSLDDVTDLSAVPALTLKYTRPGKDGKDPAPLNVLREDEVINLTTGKSRKLQLGDVVQLASKTNHNIEVNWLSTVVLWQPPKKELASVTQTCAALGIKLVFKHTDSATHAVFPTVTLADLPITVLLAGAALITRDWVDTVLELGSKPAEQGGLDELCLLPRLEDCFPPFEVDDAPWANKSLWVEDAGRENLFKGLKFLLVVDGSASTNQFKANITKCGASACEAFDVRDGFDLDQFETAVAHTQKRAGKAKIQLKSGAVIVFDVPDIRSALSGEDYDAAVRVLSTSHLSFVAQDIVRLAILDKRLAPLECALTAEESIDISAVAVPGTFDQEPSQLAPSTQESAAAPATRRSKRGTTPTSSQAPDGEPESQLPATKARATRRATRATSAAPESAPQSDAVAKPSSPPRPVGLSAPVRTTTAKHLPQPVQDTQSQEAASKDDDIFAAPKRTLPLRRRALMTNSIVTPYTGLDGDPSVIEDSTQDTEPTQLVLPTPMTRRPGKRIAAGMEVDSEADLLPLPPPSVRLARKRNARGGGFSLRLGDEEEESELGTQVDEPPLKKFKALYEGTEQSQALAPGESLDFGASQIPSLAQGLASLSVLREVDEEESSVIQSQAVVSRELPLASGSHSGNAGSKRRRDEATTTEPAAKRRAVGPSPTKPQAAKGKEKGCQAVARRNNANTPLDSQRTTGAVGGVLSAADAVLPPLGSDKVLTALASKKRGRKLEDEFDREFNNLRISKPESEVERRIREEEDQYMDFDFDEVLKGRKCVEVREYVLREVGNDGDNVTGSFVPVRRDALDGRGKCSIWRAEWSGQQDFKKFRKVGGRNIGGKVELLAPEQKDYGMGDAYWSKSQSQSQSQADDTFISVSDKKQRLLGKIVLHVDSDDDEESFAPSSAKGRAGKASASTQSQSQSTTRGTSSKHSKAASQKTQQPLFLADPDDDDIRDADELDMDMDAEPTMTNGTQRKQQVTQSKINANGTSSRTKISTSASGGRHGPIAVDDDSDEGMTFKGFSSKKTGSRR